MENKAESSRLAHRRHQIVEVDRFSDLGELQWFGSSRRRHTYLRVGRTCTPLELAIGAPRERGGVANQTRWQIEMQIVRQRGHLWEVFAHEVEQPVIFRRLGIDRTVFVFWPEFIPFDA